MNETNAYKHTHKHALSLVFFTTRLFMTIISTYPPIQNVYMGNVGQQYIGWTSNIEEELQTVEKSKRGKMGANKTTAIQQAAET